MSQDSRQLEFAISVTNQLSVTAENEMEMICDEVLQQKSVSVIDEDENVVQAQKLQTDIPLQQETDQDHDDIMHHFDITSLGHSEESIHSNHHDNNTDIGLPKQISLHRTISAVDAAIKRKLDSIGPIKEESVESKSMDRKTKKLFICYFFICLFWGSLESLPGSLFAELIDKLNISEIGVASIFLSRAITFCISSIITAYIIDKFVKTHKYSSYILFIALISVCLVSYIDIIYIQYILWISMGFASGLIEVAIPVYTFRAFVLNSQKIWFILLTCYGLAKTLIPLIIQISIEVFNTFSYSLFFISCTALCASILLLFLSTPKHDELRSMKKEIAKTDTLRNAESVLKELGEHKVMRNIIIILFGLVLIIFSIIQSGLVTFIGLYVNQYLKISDIMSRILISTYYGGQLFYRFVVGFCLCPCIKKKIHSTTYLFCNLIIGYIIYILLFIIWIFLTININININIKIVILFIVFGCGGFVSSSTYPTIYELTETIFPINGLISCIFTMALGIGDLIIVVIMGQLFEHFNIYIYPIPLMIAAIIQIIIIIIIIILYNKYKSYESVILSAKTRELSHLSGLQRSISTLYKGLSVTR